MTQYHLKVNNGQLDIGWSAKLVAEFEPLADCPRESFWVRVESVSQNGGGVKYMGLVEDYLTYTGAHGLTMGFALEFRPENVCETRAPGAPRPVE